MKPAFGSINNMKHQYTTMKPAFGSINNAKQRHTIAYSNETVINNLKTIYIKWYREFQGNFPLHWMVLELQLYDSRQVWG